MKNGDWKKYREILERKRAELTETLRRRDEIAIEKSADAIDEMQRAAEREMAILNLDRDSHLLRNIRAALARMDEGTYGICVRCEEPISPKRLEAVPWTPFCIKCQEAAERHEREPMEILNEILMNAA